MRLSVLRPPRRMVITAAVALTVVAADAATKRTVQETLALGERHEIVPGWLVFTHVQNTGAAYGLFAGQRWLLVLSAAAIALATPFLLRALPVHGRMAWAGPVLTGMIIGGAAGNLAQRAAGGYVTDFIQVPPIELFQVFNLADAAISVAIVLLIALSLFATEPPATRQHDGSATVHEAHDEPVHHGAATAPPER